MVDDSQKENTTPQASAQGEPAKPLTLGAIEAKLVEDELREIARGINTAIRSLRSAVEALPHGHRAGAWLKVRENLEFYSLDVGDIRKGLGENGIAMVAERAAVDFLKKVAEIRDIAEDAASRVEG